MTAGPETEVVSIVIDAPGNCTPELVRTSRVGAHHGIAISACYGRGNYPLSRDELYQKLKDQGINGRRYFYPLISDFPMYRGLPSSSPSNLPVASSAAQKVLCLPIYPALSDDEQNRVIDQIHKVAT